MQTQVLDGESVRNGSAGNIDERMAQVDAAEEEKKKKQKSIEEIEKLSKTDKRRAEVFGEKEKSEQDNNYNFFYKYNDEILRIGSEYLNDGGADDNTIVINAHGSKSRIDTPDGKMYAKDIHKFLYDNNKLYKKSVDQGIAITLRIEACKTGNGLAKELSRYNKNMMVIAPTTNIMTTLGFINNLKDNGKYLTFKNGKVQP